MGTSRFSMAAGSDEHRLIFPYVFGLLPCHHFSSTSILWTAGRAGRILAMRQILQLTTCIPSVAVPRPPVKLYST